jgi:hypothetical protein
MTATPLHRAAPTAAAAKKAPAKKGSGTKKPPKGGPVRPTK